MASSLPHRPLVIATPAGAGYHSSSFSILPSFLIYKSDGALQRHASRQLLKPNPPIDRFRQRLLRQSIATAIARLRRPPARRLHVFNVIYSSPPTRDDNNILGVQLRTSSPKNIIISFPSMSLPPPPTSSTPTTSFIQQIFVLTMLLSSAHVEPVFAGATSSTSPFQPNANVGMLEPTHQRLPSFLHCLPSIPSTVLHHYTAITSNPSFVIMNAMQILIRLQFRGVFNSPDSMCGGCTSHYYLF